MSTDRDTTRIVRSWLEEGATALPDRVLDAVLDQVPATHQRRSSWLARRSPLMSNNLVRTGIAAAAVVVAVIVGVNLAPRSSTGPPHPSPTTATSPTVTASPTEIVVSNPFTVIRSFPQSLTGVVTPAAGSDPEGIGMAVGPDGLLYVTDLRRSVTVINPATGLPMRSWGRPGTGDGEFGADILSVAVAPNGLVYVADPGNYRIQVFDPDGTYVRQIGSQGTAEGQFEALNRMFGLGADGSTYVADSGDNTVTKFDDRGAIVWRRGGAGETDPALRHGVHALAFTTSGNLLATSESGLSALLLNPATGAVASPWPGGKFVGASAEPTLDAAGNIYLFQYVPLAIQVFSPGGTLLGGVSFDDAISEAYRLYPSPVFTPDGHGYSFDPTLGLVELEVQLPGA
jgi:sugar lactone lactonase YvrE